MDVVLEDLRSVLKDESASVNGDTILIGEGGVLDSLGLVELCLRLEDRARHEGFDFDWTSESAMSQSRSIFRTVGALSEEFLRQSAEKK